MNITCMKGINKLFYTAPDIRMLSGIRLNVSSMDIPLPYIPPQLLTVKSQRGHGLNGVTPPDLSFGFPMAY